MGWNPFTDAVCGDCHGSRSEFSFSEMQYFPCSGCDGTGRVATKFQIWWAVAWSYVPKFRKRKKVDISNGDTPIPF